MLYRNLFLCQLMRFDNCPMCAKIAFKRQKDTAHPKRFVNEGSTLTFFLVGDGREDQNIAISGPFSCRGWPNIVCWLESFVIFRGSGPVLLRNPLFLLPFGEGVRTSCPPPHSGSVHGKC